MDQKHTVLTVPNCPNCGAAYESAGVADHQQYCVAKSGKDKKVKQNVRFSDEKQVTITISSYNKYEEEFPSLSVHPISAPKTTTKASTSNNKDIKSDLPQCQKKSDTKKVKYVKGPVVEKPKYVPQKEKTAGELEMERFYTEADKRDEELKRRYIENGSKEGKFVAVGCCFGCCSEFICTVENKLRGFCSDCQKERDEYIKNEATLNEVLKLDDHDLLRLIMYDSRFDGYRHSYKDSVELSDLLGDMDYTPLCANFRKEILLDLKYNDGESISLWSYRSNISFYVEHTMKPTIADDHKRKARYSNARARAIININLKSSTPKEIRDWCLSHGWPDRTANQIAFYPFKLFSIVPAWRLKEWSKDITIRTRMRDALIKMGINCEPIHSTLPSQNSLSTDSADSLSLSMSTDNHIVNDK